MLCFFSPLFLFLTRSWFLARDTFLGINCKKQDIALALRIAEGCDHPDARELTSFFRGWNIPITAQVAKLVLERQGDSVLALALLGLVWLPKNITALRKAAELGSEFAAFQLGDYRQLNIESHDPFVLGKLGDYFQDAELHRRAAELGNVNSYRAYANQAFKRGTVGWFEWSIRACALGCDDIESVIDAVDGKSGIIVGEMLWPHSNLRTQQVFGIKVRKPRWKHVGSCLKNYSKAIKIVRNAIRMWLLCARRFNSRVNRDIRKIIATMIWASRFDKK